MTKHGKDFEEAVYCFVKTLDPKATVRFDHSRPDRDTGKPRQCDVWVDATFGGHWPLSILVSCKDHGRKLHSGDIGTFINEKQSTSASAGVIYSRAGFSEPALLKAKVNGISCCRLYQNQPADFPEVILLGSFLAKYRLRIGLLSNPNPRQYKVWNDLFCLVDEDTNESLIDIIVNGVVQDEERASKELELTNNFASTSELLCEFRNNDESWDRNLKVIVVGHWATYQAKMESVQISGSYCFENQSFGGENRTPSIDTQSGLPGNGWQEVDAQNIKLPASYLLIVLKGLKCDVMKHAIREAWESQLLPGLSG